MAAGRGEECRDLLFDLAWLRRKLAARDVHALMADAKLCATDSEVKRLGRMLRMSAHVLGRDKHQLSGQLLGRLGREDGNRTARLLDMACREIPANVLVPYGARHLLPPGALTQTLDHGVMVFGAAVLADGARALSWSPEGTLHLWDLASGEGRAALKGQRSAIDGAVMLADGARTVLGGEVGIYRPYAPAVGPGERGNPAAQRAQRRGLWRGGVGGRRERRIVSGGWESKDHTLRLWDLKTGQSRALEGHSLFVFGAVMLANGARALSWSADGTLRLWDLGTGESRALEGHNDLVSGAVVLASGARALSWGMDRTMRLWDLGSFQELTRFVGDYPLSHCDVGKDDRYAVAGALQGRLMCFDLSEWARSASSEPQPDS